MMTSMLSEPAAERRAFKRERIECDLVVTGGGLAGTCCAITAARAGIRVGLVQDRPVLGGNSSSEVRLWVLGATAHMHNNNRWAREGGVMDEILVENMYRNPDGNGLIYDTILLEKVVEEPNIRLLLNTSVYEVTKADRDTISEVEAFCSQNSTLYTLAAPLFCDATGDGAVAFLSGAAFRMGAESSEEFGEKFAPTEDYGYLLGHSIYFYSKDVGKPVKFIPPSYALDDITQIPRFRSFDANTYGCRLWWIEYGGRLDTVHDTEIIKWELWKVVYGVWNYIKNSGKFPDAENLTLEWVGHVPGKRESRRFEAPCMLTQQDIVEQHSHDDAVAFGGWSIDLHPADGVFSEKPGCDQWHARGVYQMPYSMMYSRNIDNLFLAGRIISASHVAFGSTRVMATLANAAQAVGMAAAICIREGLQPAQMSEPKRIQALQRSLMRRGQHIPGMTLDDPDDLVQQASISASSTLKLGGLPSDGPLCRLERSWAQMLPVAAGRAPAVTFTVDAATPTTLELQLRTSDRPDNHTPDVILASRTVELAAGAGQNITADFDVEIDAARYVFYCLMANEQVQVRCSEQRVTGIVSVRYERLQKPDHDIGVEVFEMWCPQRRPGGHNFAMTITPPLAVFGPEHIANGLARPTDQPNAWAADFADGAPMLQMTWDTPQTIAEIDLSFDTDYDHPMESVLLGHPEDAMPFCVKHYRVLDEAGRVIAERTDNHQTHHYITLDQPVTTRQLTIEVLAVHGNAPAAVFAVRCYGEAVN